jgi:hypothetical protein
MITQDLTRPIRALGFLTYEDVVEIGRSILGRIQAEPGSTGHDMARDEATLHAHTRQKIALDLSACSDTTTPALAQLVVVRRQLLHSGCDIVLTGLHGRARGVYEVNRLQTVLPATSAVCDDADGHPGPGESLNIA